MLRKFSLVALLLAAPVLRAQTSSTPTWYTVTQENSSIAVTLPAGTTYRFGDYTNNVWSAPVTVSQATTISPVSMGNGNPFPFSDPDPGTVKELDVVETSSTQSIVVTNLSNNTTAALVVPALAVATTTTTASTTTTTTPGWYTVTQESTTTAVTLPAGTTYRFGDYTNNKWSSPVTVSAATTISPVSMGNGDPFPFSDPDPGFVKELDVQETSTSQSVTLTNLAVSPNTVTALAVPPLGGSNTVPMSPGTSYTLTFSNFAVAPGTAQNALMFAFVNAPSSGGNETWEGTQMNLTIGGVTMTCTYGQTYTSGVFTLNCTVPTSTTTSGS